MKTVTIPNPSSHRSARDFVFQVTESGCHECVSHSNSVNGYTRVRINKKMVLMHRWRASIATGYQSSLDVLHRCDNPSCSNPDHLFFGTHKDNMVDMVKKGRLTGTILSVAEVRTILKDLRICENIAKDYGVSKSLISAIKRGERWAHVFKEREDEHRGIVEGEEETP